MKKWIAFILLAGLIVADLAGGRTAEGEGLGGLDAAFEMELFRLVNAARIANGRAPLAHSEVLTESARAHNQDMLIHHFFDHRGSDGSLPPDRACARGYTPYGWGGCYVGENISLGYLTPDLVMAAWMDSVDHRNNLLDGRYREGGVGHARSDDDVPYWTMDLGARPYWLPVFINDDAEKTISRNVTVTLTKEGVSSYGSLGPITGVRACESPSFEGSGWRQWEQAIPFVLSAGDGTRTVYVQFTDGSAQVVSSDSILLDTRPVLSVAPQRLVLIAEAGCDDLVPASPALFVNNVGGDTLEWAAVASETWLLLDTTGGIAPAAVGVGVDRQQVNLEIPSTYGAQVTITATSPDAQETPQTVPVMLLVVERIYRFRFPLVLAGGS